MKKSRKSNQRQKSRQDVSMTLRFPSDSKDVDQRKVCLASALTAVTGDRHLNYGAAEDNFGRIAHLQNAYLETRQSGKFEADRSPDSDNLTLVRGQPITPTDVAMLLIMVKIGRLANQPNHADSWSDIAGYAACGAGINVK